MPLLISKVLDFDSQSLQLDIRRQTSVSSRTTAASEWFKYRSPVNGIVGNLSTNNKTFLSKNQAILTIVDLSKFEVEIEIPESYADDLSYWYGG